ncbi:hypothetical protein, variant 1 [Aphanomyces invadans]|uniref:Uncharacterized protein n=1 Tax=Aphanomyces invadans TaxID=157072 RepID=A0A024TFM1_9STRA|nr:hypothetical protein, variant 1 [Aphanomyces invadans]ETV92157.1 hypothetical protein, variant 1 [Aphanomyces invadans]|eukprot:XP_008879121.1 hypothetical protein, variant 1 [Aphanomyces invadans]
MAAALPPLHVKKIQVGVEVLPPVPLSLDEGEDPTEDVVDAIVREGGRVLYEKYLNASVVPYTCTWVTRSLEELLAVVTMNTQCDFVVPTWDAESSVIPLDNLARAMVPVAPMHQSKYKMVLSVLESEDSSTDVGDCIEAPPWKQSDGNNGSVTDGEIFVSVSSPHVPRPDPILVSAPSGDVANYIQPIQEPPETNAETRRHEEERRRKLLKVLEEATISQQQQDLLAQQRSAQSSRPVSCPSTSPRKRRSMQQNSVKDSAQTKRVDASPTTPAVSIGFAVFDVQYIDGRVHKRPASMGSKKPQPTTTPRCDRTIPSRQQKDPPKVTSGTAEPVPIPVLSRALVHDAPHVDYQPTSYGNVLQDLVLMPGVKISSLASPTKLPLPEMQPPSRIHEGCKGDHPSKDGGNAARGATTTRLDIKLQSKAVERTASLFAKPPPPSPKPSSSQEERRRHPPATDVAMRIPLSPPKPEIARQNSRPRTTPSPLAVSRRPTKPK